MGIAKHQHFFRKLHSLSGIIPVGVFLMVHLSVNFTATYGEDAYNKASAIMVNLPFKMFLETFIIFVPLLFHGLYGAYIAFQAKNNVLRYKYARNWQFYLQRLSGLITLAFLIWHVWETKISYELYGGEMGYDFMANVVSSPLVLVLYIIGIVAATYHFSNGIWTFLITWGVTISPKSQKVFSYITFGIFLVITYIGIRAIMAFA